MIYSHLTDTEKRILAKLEQIDRITDQINGESYSFLLTLKSRYAEGRSESYLEVIPPEKQDRLDEGLSQMVTELESAFTHLKLMKCDEYYGT